MEPLFSACSPEDLGYIKAAAAMGLGNSDLNSMRIEEINVGA